MRIRFLHWCIAGALVANVAVYYWQHAQPPRTLPHAADGLRDLVLLSEVEGDTLADLVIGGAKEAPAVASEVPTSEGFPIKDATQEEGAAVSDGPAAAAASGVGADLSGSRMAESQAPPQPTGPRCWFAGPVDDERLGEELSALFAAASISMDLILRTVEADPDYWVYLPTDGSQAVVRRLSRELRQFGVENYPITSGPLAGGLSLGLFRSADRARGLQQDLLDRGYGADIYPRPRYRDEVWIALDDEGREVLGWPAAVGAVPGLGGVMLEERSCDA